MSGTTLSDDFLAQTLAEGLEGKFLYSPASRRWYRFDPPNWRRDDTLLLTWRVRQYLREVAEQLAGNAHNSALLSGRTIRAVESLLRSEPTLVADPADWKLTPTGMERR